MDVLQGYLQFFSFFSFFSFLIELLFFSEFGRAFEGEDDIRIFETRVSFPFFFFSHTFFCDYCPFTINHFIRVQFFNVGRRQMCR